jgi:hypothetical protein
VLGVAPGDAAGWSDEGVGDATGAGVAAETAGTAAVVVPVDWAAALTVKRNRKLRTSTVFFIEDYVFALGLSLYSL